MMGVFLFFAERHADRITEMVYDHRLAALLVVAAGGAGIYGLSALLTGALRTSEVKAALTRS